MELYITLAILAGLLGLWFYMSNRKRKKVNERIDASLEDTSIYVEGVGNIQFEDLHEMVNGNPEEGVKHTKDTMFREDLMQFEGEFLIPDLPLNEERRLSIDDAFLYLQELFGKDIMAKKPLRTLDEPLFPASIHELSEVIPLAHSIAEIMDIDPESLEIGFYEGDKAPDPDSAYENNSAAGLYYGKNEAGNYEVGFADNLHLEPERLIATIAHEFAHIKLLGEERMAENSEELTDMVPLIYGFGLFNSNSAFKFSRDNRSWSTSKLGYLTQVDWAYLFALYLYVRDEKDPEWLRHLNKTIAKDCELAYNFIVANPDMVLQAQS